MHLVVDLELPAIPEYVALTRLVVGSLASTRRALNDERVDDLKLAVSEASTNAIEAHHAHGHGGPIRVCVYEAPDRIEVHVADRGGGFDPAELPSHPPVTDPDRLNFERGLGIPLIRSLVDEVEFTQSGSGMLVRMVMFGGASDFDADQFDADQFDADQFDADGVDVGLAVDPLRQVAVDEQ